MDRLDRLSLIGHVACPYCGDLAQVMPDPRALTVRVEAADLLAGEVQFLSRHRCDRPSS